MNTEQVEQETNHAAADATGDTRQRTNLMMAKGDSEWRPRVGVMLEASDSEWLDTLAAEIRDAGGARVLRSEIVRAALAGLRELHKSRAGIFADLGVVKQPSFLEWMTMLAALKAAQQWEGVDTNGKR